MQRVFVVDAQRQPLMPCQPARARQLLRAGKASVLRRQPFTIILHERLGGDTQPLEAKVDPGSQTTGLALVASFKCGRVVVWAAELTHRGNAVVEALQTRRAVRRSRRSRHTRYRPARFNNRRRAQGWLPPSLVSRLNNTLVWVKRLGQWSPVSRLGYESVKFDTQLLQNAEISGIEYQQGTLAGYEVREYLLEKWGRKCAYCGKEHLRLQVEHINPSSRGGSKRISNLTLACEHCNQRKGNRTAAEFGYPHIQQQAERSLRDAAAVNATRWALHQHLVALGLPLETGTGGQTKFNRTRQAYPKTHWIDAACVGASGENIYIAPRLMPLAIKATGRQARRMRNVNKYGFPIGKAKTSRFHFGLQSGDLVRAVIPERFVADGTYVGHLGMRASGHVSVGEADSLPVRFCLRLQAADGYLYRYGKETVHSSHD